MTLPRDQAHLLRYALDAQGLASALALYLGSDPVWFLSGFRFGEAKPPIVLAAEDIPPDGMDQVTFAEGFCCGSRTWARRDLGYVAN